MEQFTPYKATQISRALRHWFASNARDLPWRNTQDPYKIWLSEIILQQTRVDQGMSYYYRFTELFPTVADLANADINAVLKAWEGLGYYSRARNLHRAAQVICREMGGKLPADYQKLLSLPGVGRYTAGAVASFAFGLPVPAVDGNVLRVMSRIGGYEIEIDTPAGLRFYHSVADELLDKRHPAAFNQAIMELGALVCVPKQPDCPLCPLSRLCAVAFSPVAAQLPKKKGKMKVEEVALAFLLVTDAAGRTLLAQRPHKGIWAALYQPLPLKELPQNALSGDATGKNANGARQVSLSELRRWLSRTPLPTTASSLPHFTFRALPAFQHRLTHRLLTIRLFHLHFPDASLPQEWIAQGYAAYPLDALPALPIPLKRAIDSLF